MDVERKVEKNKNYINHLKKKEFFNTIYYLMQRSDNSGQCSEMPKESGVGVGWREALEGGEYKYTYG